jgi:hypothetical protein
MSIPNGSSLENLFAELLLSSEKSYSVDEADASHVAKIEWHFEAGEFFDKWFRQHGKAYFFLFRKNLKVTNIQFAELLALIRSHNHTIAEDESIHQLQFLSVTEFYDALRQIVESFPRDASDPAVRYRLLAKMYASLISRHVVLDSFYGSCAVFLPPNLDLDLPAICAHSGYIHSCGVNVYTRKIDKAKKERFFDSIRRHLDRSPSAQPIFFMVYAHEDFTRSERPAKKEYLRDGLDDVKIYIEKFYMAAERLVDVVEAMRQEFAGRLVFQVPGEKPGDFKLSHKDCDQTKTIWLLVDHSIGDTIKQRGADRFYICYEQLYLNESLFQLFDENKPGWLTPTTIPHTLLAAMLNLTEISQPERGPCVLADPFVGTGTTWLEATRLSELSGRCTDRSNFSPLMIRDNLEFFCRSSQELQRLQKDLEELIGHLEKPGPVNFQSSTSVIKDYKWAISFYNRLVNDSRGYAVPMEDPARVSELAQESPFRRLLFYLTLRTLGRSSVSIRHGTDEWEFAYANQSRHLAGQIGLLAEVRGHEESATISQVGYFNIFQGKYSLGCTVARERLAELLLQVKSESHNSTGTLEMGIFDVLADENSSNSSLKPGSCDVIITDPPYGFNTDDDLEALALLYSQAIEKMIRALKDDGQLVLCLLDRSHTGRRSPYFTHKELITQQVLAFAERTVPKREVIMPAYAVPKQRDLFRPPYYWESERALRRAILHFRIRTLN